jgi:hypothetical protein
MISNLSRMTTYHVEDRVRPWGRIHDFLLEFPGCKARYFSVDASVGFGVKEIWAPMESVGRVDPQHMALQVGTEIDKEMVWHLSRLETPAKDTDELRLHRLYRTRPDWAALGRKKGGKLRRNSRLVRGSDVIGFEVLSSNGGRGLVRDLLFDDLDLSLQKLRVEFETDGRSVILDMDVCNQCVLKPEAHAVYLELA